MTPGVVGGDAGEVTDREGPDAVLDSPSDDSLGGLVVSEAYSPAMLGLGAALGGSELAPPPRATLAPARRLGRHPASSGFGVGEMNAFFSADHPPRNHECLLLAGSGEGMDDPYIDPGDPSGIEIMVRDRDCRGDIREEPPGLAYQGDRADLRGRVRDVPGETEPQRGGALGDRQAHPSVLQHERALIPADREQRPLAPRIPRSLTLAAPPPRLQERSRVPAHHGPDCGHREFSTRDTGDLAAPRLACPDRLRSAREPVPVHVDERRPHVPSRPQQPEAASRLAPRQAETHTCCPMHRAHTETITMGCDK